MGFSRKEYWSGLPYPLPENLRDPGILPTQGSNPCLLHLPSLAVKIFTTRATWEVPYKCTVNILK